MIKTKHVLSVENKNFYGKVFIFHLLNKNTSQEWCYSPTGGYEIQTTVS